MTVIIDGSTGIDTIQNATVTAAKIASGQTPAFNGIQFPATQAASSDANTLDDYEEGTWTPSIPTGSPTYTTRYGHYTKVGNVVTVFGFIQVGSITSPSGFTLVSGLPFASVNNSTMYNKMATAWNSFNVGKAIMILQVAPGGTNMQANGCTDNQAFADVSASGYSAGTWISFTGQYFAA